MRLSARLPYLGYRETFMFKSILHGLRGVMSLLFYSLNTIACCIPIFIIALIKAVLPIKPIQNGCRRMLTAIATFWIAVNKLNQRLFNGICWDVKIKIKYTEEKECRDTGHGTQGCATN